MTETRTMLAKHQVVELVGLCFPKIWNLIREGQFPAPVDICGMPRWFADEIGAWQAALPRKQYKRIKPPRKRFDVVQGGR